jgi:hypothetical protein
MLDIYVESKREGKELKDNYTRACQYLEAASKVYDNYETDPSVYEEEFCATIDEEYHVETGHVFVRIHGKRFTPSQIFRRMDVSGYMSALKNYADARFEDDPCSDANWKQAHSDFEDAGLDYNEAVKKCVNFFGSNFQTNGLWANL